MPVSGPNSYPSRIAIVGDLGLTYNITSTVNHKAIDHPELILICILLMELGQIATLAHSLILQSTKLIGLVGIIGEVTDIRYMEPLISSVPLMVIEGNHEIELQAENQTFFSYSSRFAFPSEESGSSSTFYYSFNARGIHFIMLGAYTSYNKSGDQYKWLERNLASVDREVTPWSVASWHPPWYSTYKSHYREAEYLRMEMEDPLYKYGVDVVCNGHVKNDTQALWTWHRNQDIYNAAGDQIYIVRQPEKCLVKPQEH